MPGKSRKKTNDILLLALACGATVDAAAHNAGVSRRTAHRRLKDPAFQAELKALQGDMLRRTSAMLTASGMEFVKTIVDLHKPSNAGAVRLGAARVGIELGARLREAVDLEQRIAALEELAGLRGQP